MPVALGPLEVRLEHAQRQLGIAGVGGVPGVGERDAQRALVVLGHALVGGARLGAAPGRVGDQRAMVAQVVLRPVRLLRRVEKTERLLGLVLRLVEPGPRQRAGQLADRVGAGRLEVLVGFRVAPRLEVDEPQEGVGGAMRGLRLRRARAPALRARPVAFDGSIRNDCSTSTSLPGSRASALPVVGWRQPPCRSGRARPGRRDSCRAASGSRCASSAPSPTPAARRPGALPGKPQSE